MTLAGRFTHKLIPFGIMCLFVLAAAPSFSSDEPNKKGIPTPVCASSGVIRNMADYYLRCHQLVAPYVPYQGNAAHVRIHPPRVLPDPSHGGR
jgi:hypothetical protein